MRIIHIRCTSVSPLGLPSVSGYSISIAACAGLIRSHFSETSRLPADILIELPIGWRGFRRIGWRRLGVGDEQTFGSAANKIVDGGAQAGDAWLLARILSSRIAALGRGLWWQGLVGELECHRAIAVANQGQRGILLQRIDDNVGGGSNARQ